MTVQELIKLLQAEDPDALVGAAFADITGYVNGIDSIKHANHGEQRVVVLDMNEETIGEEELDITPRRG
jgi:hypothetical protein